MAPLRTLAAAGLLLATLAITQVASQPIPLAYVPISGNSGHTYILYGNNGTVDHTQVWGGAEVFCAAFAGGSLASVTGNPQRRALMVLDSYLNYNLTINGTMANGTACSWFGYNSFHGDNGEGSFTDGGNIKQMSGGVIIDNRTFNILSWCGAVCGGKIYRRDCDTEANAFICKTKAPPATLNASGVARLATVDGDDDGNYTAFEGNIGRACNGNSTAAIAVLNSFGACFNNRTNVTFYNNGTLANGTAVNGASKSTLLPSNGPEITGDLNAQWQYVQRYAADLGTCPRIYNALIGAPPPVPPAYPPAYPPPTPCNCWNKAGAVDTVLSAISSCPGLVPPPKKEMAPAYPPVMSAKSGSSESAISASSSSSGSSSSGSSSSGSSSSGSSSSGSSSSGSSSSGSSSSGSSSGGNDNNGKDKKASRSSSSVPTPTQSGLAQCARFRGTAYCASNVSLTFSWADAEAMCEVSGKNAGMATIDSAETWAFITSTFALNASFPGFWLAAARGFDSPPMFFGGSSGWLQNQTVAAANASMAFTNVTNCANKRGCAIALVYNATSNSAALQYVDASFAMPVLCQSGSTKFVPRPYGSQPMPEPNKTARPDGRPIIKVPTKATITLSAAACAAINANSAPFQYSFSQATADGWNARVASALQVLAGDIKVRGLTVRCARRRGLLQTSSSTVTVSADIQTPPSTTATDATAAGNVFSSAGANVYGTGQFAADFAVTDATVTADPAVTEDTTSTTATNVPLIVGLTVGLVGAAIIVAVVAAVVIHKRKQAGSPAVHPDAASPA